MISLIILGRGGHALSCLDIIKSTEQFEVIGYVDNCEEKDPWYGIPFVGTDDDLPRLVKKCPNFFLGIGQIQNAKVRQELVSKLRALNAVFPIVISPNAHVGIGAKISEGAIVMNGVHLGPASVVGEFGILNTHSVVEHGVKLGAFVHISTSAVVNGDVEVGDGSFIGSNSVLCQGIKVPEDSFVQAGAFIGRKHAWR
jgi:sugar O-acyltransferase (sialic acid O-acetyltransferase NeuD family)